MKIFLILFSLLLLSCGYDEFPEWSGSGESEITPNSFIESLNALSDDEPAEIMYDYIIKAKVVSSDKSSNFYKSVFVDDGTAALELMAGLYSLDNLYPEGSELIISAKGLFIAKNQGVTQLGTDAGSSVSYFSHRYILANYVEVNSYDNIVSPISLSINELTEAYCGRLIKLSDLYYSDEDYSTWASYSSWTGYYSDSYRSFEDASGSTIKVLTSGYADFVAETIPSCELDICGILFYDSSEGFYLKLRDLSDLTLHSY